MILGDIAESIWARELMELASTIGAMFSKDGEQYMRDLQRRKEGRPRGVAKEELASEFRDEFRRESERLHG